MTRRSLEANIEAGILTQGNAMRILKISNQLIRTYLNAQPPLIHKCFRLPASLEWRIPGPSLRDFCVTNGMPVPPELHLAAENYLRKYEPDGTRRTHIDSQPPVGHPTADFPGIE